MILTTIPTTNVTLPADVVAQLKTAGVKAETLNDLLIELASSRLFATDDTPSASVAASAIAAGARTFGLGGASLEAVKLTEKKVGYSVEDNTVSFDFEPIKAALPADITFVSSRVSGVSESGVPVSVKNTKGSLQLPENPSTVTFQVNLMTASGNLSLVKTVPVKTGEGTAVLDVFDQTSAPADMTVQENLELLNAEVALLKTKG
jgi:hypothetical protein